MTGRRIVVMARHGESEWSKNNVFCGWYDSHLSDRGNLFDMSSHIGRNYDFNNINL